MQRWGKQFRRCHISWKTRTFLAPLESGFFVRLTNRANEVWTSRRDTKCQGIFVEEFGRSSSYLLFPSFFSDNLFIQTGGLTTAPRLTEMEIDLNWPQVSLTRKSPPGS